MNKLLYTTVGFLIMIGVTIATAWINGVNSERREHHDAIKDLQARALYMNGSIPAAPIVPILTK